MSNLKCFQFHPQFCPRGGQLPQFIQSEPELLIWVSEASDIVSHGAGEIILRVAELSSLLYHHPQSLIELNNANIALIYEIFLRLRLTFVPEVSLATLSWKETNSCLVMVLLSRLASMAE